MTRGRRHSWRQCTSTLSEGEENGCLQPLPKHCLFPYGTKTKHPMMLNQLNNPAQKKE
jgi:hypothetical protein